MLVICDSIFKNEIKPLLKQIQITVLKKTAKKVINGLGLNLGKSPLPGTKLVKCTTTNPAGRIIFLVIINKNYALPVLLRSKKDKSLGMNMSFSNPILQKKLEQNLELIFQDLANDKFTKIKI